MGSQEGRPELETLELRSKGKKGTTYKDLRDKHPKQKKWHAKALEWKSA